MTLPRLFASIALLSLVACGDPPPAAEAPAPAEPTAAPAGADTPSPAFVCPMHPDETSEVAGAKCSKCGMDLEPPKSTSAHSSHDHPH